MAHVVLKWNFFLFLNIFFHNLLSLENKSFFFSVGSQDQFVNFMLEHEINKREKGYFIEIGSSHPVISNNTFYFERYRGFEGWIFQTNYGHLRKNHFFYMSPNTFQIPYKKLLCNCPDEVDFLSVNLGNKNARLLQILPARLKFKVITLTCDLEEIETYYLEKERLFLEKRGYRCVGKKIIDVLNTSIDHWWVHPDYFEVLDLKRLKDLFLHELDHYEAMRKIQQEFQDQSGSDYRF